MERSYRLLDLPARTAALILEDRHLYLLILSFLTAASSTLIFFSKDVWTAYSLYFSSWLEFSLAAILIYLALKLAINVYCNRRETVRLSAFQHLAQIITPNLCANFVLYTAITIFFGAFTG